MLLTRSFNDYFHRSLKYHPLRTIFFAFVSNKIFVDLWSFIFDVHDNLTINIAIQYIIAKVSSRNANIQRSAMRPIQMSTEKGGFFECLAVTRFELHKWEPALSWPQSRLDQDRANERTNEPNVRGEHPDKVRVIRSNHQDALAVQPAKCASTRFLLSFLLACTCLSPDVASIASLFGWTDIYFNSTERLRASEIKLKLKMFQYLVDSEKCLKLKPSEIDFFKISWERDCPYEATGWSIRKIFFKRIELILEEVVTIILCVIANFATENLLIINYLLTLSMMSMWFYRSP